MCVCSPHCISIYPTYFLKCISVLPTLEVQFYPILTTRSALLFCQLLEVHFCYTNYFTVDQENTKLKKNRGKPGKQIVARKKRKTGPGKKKFCKIAY